MGSPFRDSSEGSACRLVVLDDLENPLRAEWRRECEVNLASLVTEKCVSFYIEFNSYGRLTRIVSPSRAEERTKLSVFINERQHHNGCLSSNRCDKVSLALLSASSNSQGHVRHLDHLVDDISLVAQ